VGGKIRRKLSENKASAGFSPARAKMPQPVQAHSRPSFKPFLAVG
jgi:hypothetical protein